MKIHSLRKSFLFIGSFLNPSFNGVGRGGVSFSFCCLGFVGFSFLFSIKKKGWWPVGNFHAALFSRAKILRLLFLFPLFHSLVWNWNFDEHRPSSTRCLGQRLVCRQEYFGDIYHLGKAAKEKSTTVFLFKCTEWIKFLIWFRLFRGLFGFKGHPLVKSVVIHKLGWILRKAVL